MRQPRVYIGMPYYVSAAPEAVLAGSTYATQKNQALFMTLGGPFHCHNFNQLLNEAVNGRSQYGWTHFAMLHSDVYPQSGWLDLLLDEMDRMKVDVLSVVIPQKMANGLTSTAALDLATLHTTRLTMQQVSVLPTTFTSEDLVKINLPNHQLLISSGLWLSKIHQSWIDEVYFSAPSRRYKDDKGLWQSAVFSEDWNFSRQLAQLGVPYAATRCLEAIHLGGGLWSNKESYGAWMRDMEAPVDVKWALGKKP